MNKIIAGVLFSAGLAGTAAAADIAPLQAHTAHFPGNASVLVFFTPERDGFHVVSTTQDGIGAEARVARFVTVLAEGQQGTVSFPHGVSGKPATLVFSRAGSRLHIDAPVDVASAQ